jgi:hypothetical protein
VSLAGGPLRLPRTDYDALAQFWHANRALLPTPIDPASARMFVAMAARYPTLASADPGVVQSLLAEACASGSVPSIMVEASREVLREIAAQMQSLPSANRKQWLKQVHAANFGERFASLEDFLVALLEANP